MDYGKIGLDIGSTTLKIVVLDENDRMCFSKYTRHNAHIAETLKSALSELNDRFATTPFTLTITGSVGMGIAERNHIDFVQEVVASVAYARHYYPQTATLIDIGGEDAKIVLLNNGVPDMRMNGNCAGGTGAFIDQMALLLNTTPAGLDDMAQHAKHIHPIASRCGVFAKTDIQNLIAKNTNREEIAASIFHAVAVQTIVTLSHGYDVATPILLCGGPLAFLKSLRKAFADYLHTDEAQMICPEAAQLLPAWGTALSSAPEAPRKTVTEWITNIEQHTPHELHSYTVLPPLFSGSDELAAWRKTKREKGFGTAPLSAGEVVARLGIDSGSTTTKIALFDDNQRLLYTYYASNNGDPITAVKKGLSELLEKCKAVGCSLSIKGSCVTGYGEDLIRAAFGIDTGIIETIAHYLAAKEIVPEVSFILDIGGQDMKAIFVDHKVITRMEINEACSSGCGSFIETFAKSLDYTVEDFAATACTAAYPCDLGTRCTVFMNSRVKQVLREGASVADIAAGLSYSVIKNCLYKVLKLRSADEMGRHIVVQGGTMRNDAVVRAFEKLTGQEVFRSEHPELMGAIGCALYAQRVDTKAVPLEHLLHAATYTSDPIGCRGCENQCQITRYRFSNGNTYFSGNKCERHFSNRGDYDTRGENAYIEKLKLLFDRPAAENGRMRVGIPRCLNLFEEYPFWHTLLTECGIEVALSDASNMRAYERNVRKVMSDNICFPAKLVHAHIDNLIQKKVDRILMPYVLHEQQDKQAVNSYNCPIVTGYSDVIRSVENLSLPFDTPVISFQNRKKLYRQCSNYLGSLGIDRNEIRRAFRRAWEEQHLFASRIKRVDEEILQRSRAAGRLTLLVAGRPYHADPLIQHKISDMIASMGVDVITDDIVRGEDISLENTHFVAQWSYPNRILKAAIWTARQDEQVQFVEMTSFGCGPDAALTDEVRETLGRYGKSNTLLKIDDVSNTGSLKLRIRSVIESLKLEHTATSAVQPFVSTPHFEKKDRSRKILVPFFTPFISPLIPVLMKRAGYDAENMPLSNENSIEAGLQYANNEICYPATLIVGDIVTALKSGRYDPNHTAVAITQTGGQCRASNYIALIRRALVNAGFAEVPVISVSPGSGLKNEQPGFQIPWLHITRAIIGSILFTDALARIYCATAVRETTPGEARKLHTAYTEKAARIAAHESESKILSAFEHLLKEAVTDFSRICETKTCPRVGIVGEIYLKFNPFAQKGLSSWLIEHHIEAVPPALTDFFMQGFINYEVKRRSDLGSPRIPVWLMRKASGHMHRIVSRFNGIASGFPYFLPFGNVFEEASAASEILSLNAQFGEGWLLPGEIASFARHGVNNIISLQPFGCIANHIVSKGVEKRIRQLYPQLNLLSLDFDGSVSDVNILNRLLLFVANLKQ